MNVMRLMVIGSVSLLAACATSENPSEGGFFGGVQGLSSGSYERRASEREENLARMREMQRELDEESARLDSQKQQRRKLLQREKQKLAALDTDVKSLEKKLSGMRKEAGVSSRRVADLEQRLQGLKGGLSSQKSALDALEGSGPGTADGTRRQQLEVQQRALQKEYETLLELTLMLAQ